MKGGQRAGWWGGDVVVSMGKVFARHWALDELAVSSLLPFAAPCSPLLFLFAALFSLSVVFSDVRVVRHFILVVSLPVMLSC